MEKSYVNSSPLICDDADYERFRVMSGDEKLQILLDLIMPENPDGAIIERSARVHPLTEHKSVKYVIVGAWALAFHAGLAIRATLISLSHVIRITR